MADRHGLQRDLDLAGAGIAQDQGFDGQITAEFMADRGTDFARHLSLPEACFAPHWWQRQASPASPISPLDPPRARDLLRPGAFSRRTGNGGRTAWTWSTR
jgi:hypothetical protein